MIKRITEMDILGREILGIGIMISLGYLKGKR